jgi:hypothetical protein
MVSNCANPACNKPLYYLREGRIYVFDTAVGTMDGAKKAERRVEHYWLCGSCATTLALTQDAQGSIRMLRKPRAVHELDESVPSAVPSSAVPSSALRSRLAS